MPNLILNGLILKKARLLRPGGRRLILSGLRGKGRITVSDQPQNPQKSKMDQACARLETAVSRLEAALKATAPGNGSPNDAPDALMTEELAAVRDENAALKQMNEKVSGRLDSAIGRLKEVLE